jgi:hypothetical protein
VRYVISASLDAEVHVVTGTLRLTWENPSAKPAASLPFHLYLNAFKHEGTLWLWESFKDGRRARRKGGGWGGIDVERVRVDGARAAVALQADGTVMRVTPARPVPGRARARVSLRFTATLPRVRARTGYAGDFHLVGQWFPKIGVRDADGTWHCHPFHMLTEFYADFGTYDVTLEVPQGYAVAATGVRVGAQGGDGGQGNPNRKEKRKQAGDRVGGREGDGRQGNLDGKEKVGQAGDQVGGQAGDRVAAGRRRYRYRAEDVHDFAWMAAPGARRVRRRLGDVRLEVVYFDVSAQTARRHLDHMAKALERLQRWYAPYPYPVLTAILVPTGRADGKGDAHEAGGMEYPTLFTSMGDHEPLLERFGPLNTTVHELVHQYFYGLLASNEYQEPWLDEGLTTYVTGLIMDDLYGRRRSALDAGSLHIGYFPLTRLWYRMHPDLGAPGQRAPTFASSLSYFTNVYGKSALALRTLERQIGAGRMRALLRDYVRGNLFGHPRGEDFFAAVDRHVKSGALRRFVREAIRTAGVLDYRVARLQVRRLRALEGRFTNDTDRARRAKHRARRERHDYLNRVLLHRRGALRLPVTVELRFAGGERLRRSWDGQGRSHWIEVYHDRPLVSAVLDPERTLALERTLLDNGLRRHADARPARRLAGRLLSALQLALGTVGF